MLKTLAATLALVAAAAPAQVTSYRSDNVRPIDGEQNRIVCEREEQIGTRLGTKKVCLTVAEWKVRHATARTHAEQLQAYGCVSDGKVCRHEKEILPALFKQ